VLQEGEGVEEHGNALGAAGWEHVCEVIQETGEEEGPWVVLQLGKGPHDIGDLSAAAVSPLGFQFVKEPTYKAGELRLLAFNASKPLPKAAAARYATSAPMLVILGSCGRVQLVDIWCLA
jgi:hypothetical protein